MGFCGFGAGRGEMSRLAFWLAFRLERGAGS